MKKEKHPMLTKEISIKDIKEAVKIFEKNIDGPTDYFTVINDEIHKLNINVIKELEQRGYNKRKTEDMQMGIWRSSDQEEIIAKAKQRGRDELAGTVNGKPCFEWMDEWIKGFEYHNSKHKGIAKKIKEWINSQPTCS